MGNPDDYDAYLILCPSCGVAIVEDFEKFVTDDMSLGEKAKKIASHTKSLSMFLEENGLRFRSAEKNKVTYHTPCHLGRGLKSTAEPYLRQLLGAHFVPLKDTDVCCGFAGSYSVDFPGISSGILAKKIENIRETGADTVVTDCPGCIMQLDGGVLHNNLPIKVLHLSDFLVNLEIVRG
jgi:Fe-S oxidoreductase